MLSVKRTEEKKKKAKRRSTQSNEAYNAYIDLNSFSKSADCHSYNFVNGSCACVRSMFVHSIIYSVNFELYVPRALGALPIPPPPPFRLTAAAVVFATLIYSISLYALIIFVFVISWQYIYSRASKSFHIYNSIIHLYVPHTKYIVHYQ